MGRTTLWRRSVACEGGKPDDHGRDIAVDAAHATADEAFGSPRLDREVVTRLRQDPVSLETRERDPVLHRLDLVLVQREERVERSGGNGSGDPELDAALGDAPLCRADGCPLLPRQAGKEIVFRCPDRREPRDPGGVHSEPRSMQRGPTRAVRIDHLDHVDLIAPTRPVSGYGLVGIGQACDQPVAGLDAHSLLLALRVFNYKRPPWRGRDTSRAGTGVYQARFSALCQRYGATFEGCDICLRRGQSSRLRTQADERPCRRGGRGRLDMHGC